MSGGKEFEALVDGWCNGTLTDGEFERLEAMLSEDEELRKEYLRRMNLHSGLHESCEGGEGDDGESVAARRGGPERGWAGWVALAAMIVAVAGVVWMLKDEGGGGEAEREMAVTEEPVKRGVAVLVKALGVEWEGAGWMPAVGSAFEPRVLALKRGLVQIDFFSGASVVLEGPARLDVVSSTGGQLHYGKARVRVPDQARGFSISTERAEFIDLGTEFALELTRAGREELHVFEGEVEVVERDGSGDLMRTVVEGNGLAAIGEGLWEVIEPDEERFVGQRELSQLTREEETGRYESWKQKCAELSGHPDLVVHYDFEATSEEQMALTDRGRRGIGGAIVGCRWAEGRWPGKGALEFKQSGDRVRFDVPGEFTSLTLMAWVRIDGFDRLFNSIMLTDEFENGHLHWQVKSDGRIDLGVKPPGESRLLYLSPKAITGQDLGRWMQLVVVYDGDARQVVHYLDGREVARFGDGGVGGGTEVKEGMPLRIGAAELGNWSPAKPYDSWLARNLNGRIDEFAVFSAALGAAEIRSIYAAGRP